MHARKPRCVWNNKALKVTRKIFRNNPKISLKIKNNYFSDFLNILSARF